MAMKKAEEEEEEAESMSYLPQHLLSQILSKLPMKSVLRFKCVSKSWRYLISDSYFIKSHFNQSLTNSILATKKILIVTSDRPFRLFSVKFGLTNETTVVENIDFLFQNNVCKKYQIIGSCNGLICMKIDSLFIYVFNIWTREWREIPDCHFPCNIGFGYDDHKLVNVTFDSINIYSLNGAIHWLCEKNVSDKAFEIAVFNLVDEKLLKFPMPGNSENDFSKYSRVEVFQGCLCILPWDGGFEMPFWIMKEYGVEQSWTKLQLHPPFSNMLHPSMLLIYDEARGLMDYGGKLMLYNALEGTEREIAIPNLKFYEPLQAIIYVESLLSPGLHGSEIEANK